MFDDGDLYGIVDTHSHVHSNYAFGGGGLFHGGAYHRLGVEHALHDCSISHGEMGRKDFFGYIFDQTGNDQADLGSLLPDLVAKRARRGQPRDRRLPRLHRVADGPKRSTHQTQYYLWLQRAYLAGLRLEVLHATTNAIICDFMIGEGIQESRYGCDDMTAVDRIIDESYAMERYIDAQAGGPGLGWFRVVHTPAEAREVIAGGKLAVVLGIETSNLFDCKLTPGGRPDLRRGLRRVAARPLLRPRRAGHLPGPQVRQQVLARRRRPRLHRARQLRQQRPLVELHAGLPGPAGRRVRQRRRQLRRPQHAARRVRLAGAARQQRVRRRRSTHHRHVPGEIGMPPLVGPYCQNATLTPLGEHMITQMMARGMIIEVDHLPQWSYVRAYELLQEADYPPRQPRAQQRRPALRARRRVDDRLRRVPRRRARRDGAGLQGQDPLHPGQRRLPGRGLRLRPQRLRRGPRAALRRRRVPDPAGRPDHLPVHVVRRATSSSRSPWSATARSTSTPRASSTSACCPS
jgi:hypothetical protein